MICTRDSCASLGSLHMHVVKISTESHYGVEGGASVASSINCPVYHASLITISRERDELSEKRV